MDDDLYITEVAGQDENGQIVAGETQVIRREDMITLNDPDCEHIWGPDPSEDNKYVYGIKCTKCIVGKLVRKN